jgi:decaprenylphospho-beta-D-erythro-pentofuranosid-2-ulose 2-reductase
MTAGRVLVLGGTSEIAQAIVAELDEPQLVLAGRDAAALEVAAAAAREAGAASAECLIFDARDTARHEQLIAAAGEVELVILAVGELDGGDDPLADPVASASVIELNALAAGSLLLHAAAVLRRQGKGALVVLSSAGAARPRWSNAAYGASKAALDTLALAIGDGLAGSGARILVVRPGFVRTRMTRGLREPPLACDPVTVARATLRGLRGGGRVVWVPRSIGLMMAVLRMLPRSVFRRLPI